MNHALDFLSTTIEKINDVWVGSSSRRQQRRQSRDNKRLVNDQTIINSNGSNMLRSSIKDNRGSNISERSTSSRRLRKSNEKRSALLRRHKRLFSSRNLTNHHHQQQQQQSSGRLPEEPPPLPSADKPVLPLPVHHHQKHQYHHNQSSKSSSSFDDDDDDDDDDSDEQRDTTSEGTPLLKNVIHKQASRRADKNEEGRIFDSTSTAGIPSRVLPRRQQTSSASASSSTKVQNPHWKALQEQVQKGNLLVAEMISDEDNIDDSEIVIPWTNNERSESTKSIEKLRHEAIENFQKGSTFSPQMCLLAILLYMIGAVFMFCFLFEPQWTVIDSCYFAVSTFTTLGKSNQGMNESTNGWRCEFISGYTTSDNYPLYWSINKSHLFILIF